MVKLLNMVRRVVILVACLFLIASVGLLFYQMLACAIGFEIIYLLPAHVIASLVIIFLPIGGDIRGLPKKLNGLVLWLFLSLLTGSAILAYHFLNNQSEEVLIAEYYWEEGLELILRKNGTYKSINSNEIGCSVNYGKYELQDSLIITEPNLRIGQVSINDTLKILKPTLSIYFSPTKKLAGELNHEMQIKVNFLFE